MTFTPQQAREHIDHTRLIESLDGEDVDTQQFRNVVTAAQGIIDEMGAQRVRLHETGHYTEEGLAGAMINVAKEAATKLSRLQETILVPRTKRLQTELGKVPAPKVGDSELGDMERHRLITAYCDANGDRKIQMRADAIKNRKLATALINEDPAVTGLSPKFIGELRDILTEDPHTTERSELQRKLNAAKAAETALNGANVSVRRAIEVAN